MKNRKHAPRRILGSILALALLLPLAGPGMITESSADTRSEINSLKNDANALADQRKDIQDQLKAVQSDKNAALDRKELLEQQIGVIQKEINNIEQQIAMYDQLIAQKEEELAQAQADEAAQFDLFCRRMRIMEEQGEISYWTILFSSSDFPELLDNYMMIEEIIQYDNKVIDDLVALQERVAADKAVLEEAKAEQQEAKDKQLTARSDLKAQEGEVDKLIGEISAQEDQLAAIEADLRRAANQVDAEIRKLEKELSAQISQVRSESGFMWPLAASINTLSSLYGNRKNPTGGGTDNHTGIDIPAAKNTPIYAAKSGVVTTSTRIKGSYGEYVVVSHSDGTSTLYAHMNSRNVSKGQTVNQGDVIGYVGSTGRSTGNHLHFEIRINGSRVDPLDYFQDKALYYRGNGKTAALWDWM